MFCTKCGSEVPNGSKFCGSCGAVLTPKEDFFKQTPAYEETSPVYERPAYEQPVFDDFGGYDRQPAPKKSNKKLLLIGGVVALALILLVALFACGGSDAPSMDAPSGGGGISIGSAPNIVGSWDGNKIIINDNEIANSVAGTYSFVGNKDGTCTLYWSKLDSGSISFSWTRDEYMTTNLQQSNNDPDVVVYDLQHTARPGVTLYYCLVNDGALALISTDDFVQGEEYEMYFLAR